MPAAGRLQPIGLRPLWSRAGNYYENDVTGKRPAICEMKSDRLIKYCLNKKVLHREPWNTIAQSQPAGKERVIFPKLLLINYTDQEHLVLKTSSNVILFNGFDKD